MCKFNNFSLAFATAILFGIICLSFPAKAQVPWQIEHMYDTTVNTDVSDEFSNLNGLDDNGGSRWTYRNSDSYWYTSSSGVYIPSGESFVSIKGDYSDDLGSGLSSLNSTGYGFYVVKWRFQGARAGWHPSAWTSICNFDDPTNPTCISSPQRPGLELDIFEGHTSSSQYWDQRINYWPYDEGVGHDCEILGSSNTTWPVTSWMITAIERHPEYIRGWKNDGSGWEIIEIDYDGDDDYDIEDYDREMFSILSNKRHTGTRTGDSWLHVDFYRLYDHDDTYSVPTAGRYMIKNKYTGKCLRPKNGSSSNGTDVVQYTCNSGWSSMQWDLEKTSDHQWRLENQLTGNRYLDLSGTGTNAITEIRNEDSSDLGQRFYFIPEGNYWRIGSHLADGNALRPKNAGTSNNTAVVGYPLQETWSSMQWELIEIN